MNFSKAVGGGARGMLSGSDAYHASSDATLFSSSLPVLPHEKLILNNTENGRQSVEGNDLLKDIEEHIGSLLPDEDELLAGVMDGFHPNLFPNGADESEEIDLFGSGGGMELESDLIDSLGMGMSKVSLGDGVAANGVAAYNPPNGVGTVAGEHPYGEHPSRTLFVRNINSNVEDSELRTLFEQYGDIRTLYTACKHRGFVMISYYDIRAARTAMRALQNKPLRRRKLDIHYSIPKDNPSDKDINQGTLVVFNLDPSVSCDDLLQIFGAYGEVKEIRETPHKRHHKFIEYYDVRGAEAALRSLNRSDIAGKRIKLEPSRPGGARRNLMLQLSQEFEQDDTRSLRLQVGSSIANSPPGVWPQFGSPIEHSPLQSLSKSPVFTSMSPTIIGNSLPGLASILHPQPARIAPIGKDHGRTNRNHLEQNMFNGSSNSGSTFQQSHSLPESKLSQFKEPMSSFGGSSSTGSGIETLSGPQFLWGSPNIYSEQPKGPSHGFPVTGRSPTMAHPFATTKGPPTHGFPIAGRPASLLGSSQHHHQHHHVGSAPSGIPFEGHFSRYHESPETLFMSPPAFGGVGIGHIDRGFLGSRGSVENGSPSFSTMSSPRLNPMFLGNGHYAGLGPTIVESMSERGRTRRVDQNGSQTDSKKQFQLDLDKITSGEDTRTTLMIKNIPNKYTSKMLLAAIDENHSGTYDFLYLPIDFKNKCNVGYAFINMLSPMHIIPFYQVFNGKKWEKFNSEKVASLAYGRIQGKAALVTHFQNSSLMNEDKRCRPILFHSEGSESFDQEPQPSSSLNIQVHPYTSASPPED
ncbi:protein MEI2-like 2 [Cynara cardunculus var. scolymus]|uniref:protein MEI2-like 2 n=1 Tax=Cynara cardunculus var. scolymus TaxID=59895 RepID=UPI000D627916|nr:protein MEI2-like 2 [Cynara cardunculus var. scolymus]XP_024987995.1 protein MEI2-like 2 [Cynara cardunculus var. scolymus]XP_024987996.1 protein MEI2-like 2 [Cynara cardunculus var. scolymus]XP_024987997.1 protein MEI2-like 2 [Cynara cardunculus var. scolymus]XP_024987998.1 protein MEI2-like 2 [Cynara cardunculus var. scolymus]